MMLKILVIGNSYSGKTSLVNRFVQNKFDPNYKATVACDFSMKILKLDETELRLQLWDLVGQDSRVGGINKLFCRNAVGALVVADISNRESIEATLSWKEQVDTHVALKNGDPIPMILIVNKYDLVSDLDEEKLEEHMTQAFLDEFAEQNGFVAALRVSAKTAQNVVQCFSQLVRRIFEKEVQAIGAPSGGMGTKASGQAGSLYGSESIPK